MDPELFRLTQAAEVTLGTDPTTLAVSTLADYAGKLRSNWHPYAQQRNLPTDFTAPDARALSPDELVTYIAACQLGTTRSHNRDGNRRSERENQPLDPSALGGILAALRHAHLHAGLPWNGTHPRVQAVRAGYARTSTRTKTKATPLTRDHLKNLFHHPPTSHNLHTRARATATALHIPIAQLTTLDPRSVLAITTDSATVEVGNAQVRTIQCLLTRTDDPIAEVACAHCYLRAWLRDAPEAGYLPNDALTKVRGSTTRLLRRLPHAAFARDRITVDNDDLWTTIALGLTADSAKWMRMRAALLPMWTTGLRLDDIDGLHHDQVTFPSDNVTIALAGKTEDPSRPHIITLTPEGGPFCPVAAMRNYDAWTRAYLPERSRWTPSLRGKQYTYAPVDAEDLGGRGLYQQTRLWLLDSGIDVDLAAPARRTTLTPHSARHGFADQAAADGYRDDEISDALRHKRLDTTGGYGTKNAHDTANALIYKIADDAR